MKCLKNLKKILNENYQCENFNINTIIDLYYKYIINFKQQIIFKGLMIPPLFVLLFYKKAQTEYNPF